MEEPKPQCGADNVGTDEDYDLPLHIAAVCTSRHIPDIYQLVCSLLTDILVIVFAASILGNSPSIHPPITSEKE
jgi:hypothetical protein